MQIIEEKFDYNGLPIHYKTFGKGKPCLVLHGWGARGDVMMPLSTSLRIKRTFYVIDLPGFGKSPEPPSAWDIDAYTQMVVAFMKHLNAGPCDIIAHSFGGRITLKLCAADKDKSLVDKVLITGGAGMKPQRKLSFYIRKYTAMALKWPFTLFPSAISEKGLNWLRSTKLWQALGSSDYKTLSGTMRQVFVKTVSEYLEPTLPEINHEVLLLWGENDDATPLYQAKRMEEGIKNAGLAVIDKAGHYAFLDRPNQFKLVTEAFFNA